MKMEKKTWYLCDPEKNKECRKMGCMHNAASISKSCELTSHPEFEKMDEDGNPVIHSVSYYPCDRDPKRNEIFEASRREKKKTR